MFVFKNYRYDAATQRAHFLYSNNGISFEEIVVFDQVLDGYDKAVLDRALQLAFFVIGTSYYKCFPSQTVTMGDAKIDEWQAAFLNSVYQEGMSQFAFENSLTRKDLAKFKANVDSHDVTAAGNYMFTDNSPLVMQSGGKDSLLLAELLTKKQLQFTPWYISSADVHPKLLDDLGAPLARVKRLIDHQALHQAKDKGGLDGHVPVTYIVLSIAVIQAVLLGKQTILSAIGNEGAEPHAMIDDLPVQHQWAKTWSAEVAFAEYVDKYVANNMRVGSPLRYMSELKIAEEFVEHAWLKYKNLFSSCNIGNYKQGQNNQTLGWCGNCPKCANSFLLFAPFVAPSDLLPVFSEDNLFKKPDLEPIFKGLLGVEGVMKPLECVGEIDELRFAYHLANKQYSNEYLLGFEVPESEFDYNQTYPAQEWATTIIQ